MAQQQTNKHINWNFISTSVKQHPRGQISLHDLKKKKTISSFPPLLISPENSRNSLGASFLRQSFLTDTGCATGNNNWTRSWIMTTCCGQFQQAYVLPNRGQPSISTFVERVLIARQTELVSRCPCARTVSLLHPLVFIDSFRAEWETSVHRICTDSS